MPGKELEPEVSKGMWSSRVPVSLFEVNISTTMVLLYLRMLLVMVESGPGRMLHVLVESDPGHATGKWMVGLRDFVDRGDGHCRKLEEQFGATADGIAEYKGILATSIHRLILKIGSEVLGRIGSEVIQRVENRRKDPRYEGFTAKELLTYFGKGENLEELLTYVGEEEVLIEAIQCSGMPSMDELDRLALRAEQELFRTWMRFYPPGTTFATMEDLPQEKQDEIAARIQEDADSRRIPRYQPPPCPECGKKTKTASSPKGLRNLKCKTCGHTFRETRDSV